MSGGDDVSKIALERLLKTLLALGQEKPAVLLSLTQALLSPLPLPLLIPLLIPLLCVLWW